MYCTWLELRNRGSFHKYNLMLLRSAVDICHTCTGTYKVYAQCTIAVGFFLRISNISVSLLTRQRTQRYRSQPLLTRPRRVTAESICVLLFMGTYVIGRVTSGKPIASFNQRSDSFGSLRLSCYVHANRFDTQIHSRTDTHI